MSYTAPAMEATISALSKAAPKTWVRLVDAVVDVDPDELAALRALPFASVLLDGDAIRVVGLANAVMSAVDDSVTGQIGALEDEWIARLGTRTAD